MDSSATSSLDAALRGLRDIRVPVVDQAAPSAAVATWEIVVLGIVCFALIALGMLFLFLRHRQWADVRAALRTLKQARREFRATQRAVPALQSLTAILRRHAVPRLPVGAAGLTGAQWLALLDAHGEHGIFLNGPGRVLLSVPYRDEAQELSPEVVEAVFDAAIRWIRSHP